MELKLHYMFIYLFEGVKELIRINKLSKSYGNKLAIDNLDLHIKQGELFGFLGPNGAGKTTTINILSTLLKPDYGSISINGFDVLKNANEIKSSIGLIPQELSIYEDLSAWENMMFWGKLYGLSSSLIKSKSIELLKFVDLFQKKDESVKNYSGGMKRRLNIIIGLIHNPAIIFFDEPTVGVDTQSRNFIFEMIKSLHNEGKTIIYTSHYIEEIEKLCTRVAIIDFGKLIALGTVSELCGQLSYDEKFEIFYSEDDTSKNQKTIIIQGDDVKENLLGSLQQIKNHNQIINDIKYTKANLEEVFLYHTGRKFRED